MYNNRRFFTSNIKKFFLAALFLIFPLINSLASKFPDKLSENASISILSINYNDLSHSLFSKSCLRIFDKETDFDQIIDFAFFDDFDDELFGLKFFFKSKKARIITAPFFNYFLRENERTNVSLTESQLDLSSKEVAYIYDFLAKLHKALPYYEYDFDILTNNSETHISLLLHDCYRMVGKDSTNERYLFSEIKKHNLNYRIMNDSYFLISEDEKLDFPDQELETIFNKQKTTLITVLSIISGVIFLLTLYQILAYFFSELYLTSIFRTMQILDFLILFITGIIGTLIVVQDIVSDQSLFQNNFQFLFLNPLHIIASFTRFAEIRNKRLKKIYWGLSSALSVIFIVIMTITEKAFPLICVLSVLPIFFRTLYFALVTRTSKAM